MPGILESTNNLLLNPTSSLITTSQTSGTNHSNDEIKTNDNTNSQIEQIPLQLQQQQQQYVPPTSSSSSTSTKNSESTINDTALNTTLNTTYNDNEITPINDTTKPNLITTSTSIFTSLSRKPSDKLKSTQINIQNTPRSKFQPLNSPSSNIITNNDTTTISKLNTTSQESITTPQTSTSSSSSITLKEIQLAQIKQQCSNLIKELDGDTQPELIVKKHIMELKKYNDLKDVAFQLVELIADQRMVKTDDILQEINTLK
ncbi:hypothetical protein KGF54_004844 [Candida jiufengensis]|uniref:uncharacterized protein n=1 Tax=Candida jiufengensis TaxID=497108 RepID=UPI002224AB26|nr:uncharacterized protein KGF54_004844 [Candida jiufengensis]KAI5951769.1 hypothetical protein KGF54_004844 [Candida jiufengensis]